MILDHAAIAARVPHAGDMCLLDALLAWDADTIVCRARDHRGTDHPLRSAAGLLAPAAIEYASQAAALHGSHAAADGAAPTPGFLASARGVRLLVMRLDTAPGPLRIDATRVAGGGKEALYRFALHDARGRLLVDGRIAVVLNTPLRDMAPNTPLCDVEPVTPPRDVEPVTPLRDVVPVTPLRDVVPVTPLRDVVPNTPLCDVEPVTPPRDVEPVTPLRDVVPDTPLRDVVPDTPPRVPPA